MSEPNIFERWCIWFLDRRGFSVTKRDKLGRFRRYQP